MKFNNIDKEKIYSEVANINRKGLVSEEESLDIIHAIVGMREDGICVNFDGIDNKICNDIHRMLPSALLNREQEKRAFALLVFYLSNTCAKTADACIEDTAPSYIFHL